MTDSTGESPPADERTEHIPAVEGDAQTTELAQPPSAPAADPVTTEQAHAAPPPPPASPPPPPGRWRRTTGGRPFQLLAALLVGVLLGGTAVAAVGAVTHGHHHRGPGGYYSRYERGPDGDGRPRFGPGRDGQRPDMPNGYFRDDDGPGSAPGR